MRSTLLAWVTGIGLVLLLNSLIVACSTESTTPTGSPQAGGTPGPARSTLLSTIQGRGQLICGVNDQLPGFGNVDAAGKYTGFDVDFCRAVSAAVFGEPDKVEFVPVKSANRQTAIQSGEVDMMSRNTTWTLTRDFEWGAIFAPTTYHDGQGFMVKTARNIDSIEKMDGASICVLSGTTTELNLADAFRARNLKFTPVVFDNDDATYAAYDQGRCDVVTSDQSSLISRKSTLKAPNESAILDQVISKEPLGPLVSQSDPVWADIVRWTIDSLIYAEERGITSQNVSTFASTQDPDIKRFLGGEGNLGQLMGLAPDWTAKVIASVGNYGEIFDRHLKPLGVERGLNDLYTKGGLMYSIPFR
ncbi:amino acid ABC transporter substrate-binding protein [Leptolyngbya sp. FACHB-261]|uniref:amino acid ABC transporter substrate-binding protein n=1 Tax=Leptolyngbya sp. FACHB-261 TaxID=2692806 RepID=UPI0018F04076|nr:amino acid ABC transporter substrate-binding protein [Leptolyngbya sp. FACHB-261]